MSKEDGVELSGVVTKILPGTNFEVTINNGQVITAHLGGRLRKNNIRILLGDQVSITASIYDLTKGIITYRY